VSDVERRSGRGGAAVGAGESRDGLAALRLGDGDALFLDFDGTLAEIREHPDAVRLPRESARAATALAARLGGAVAVISGRDLRDLDGRVPVSLWRIGRHGLEVRAPGEAAGDNGEQPAAPVLGALEAVTASHPGVWLERKGPIVALHFRAVPEAAVACLEAARRAAALVPDHVVQSGKMVVEVKPRAANKGRAVRAMMEQPPFRGRRPVVVGDDATDEDAFAVANELGGITVKVGDGATCATLRAPDPQAVRDWLGGQANG